MRVTVDDGTQTRELVNPQLAWDEQHNSLTVTSDSGVQQLVNFRVRHVSLEGIVLVAQTPLCSGSGRAPAEYVISILR